MIAAIPAVIIGISISVFFSIISSPYPKTVSLENRDISQNEDDYSCRNLIQKAINTEDKCS